MLSKQKVQSFRGDFAKAVAQLEKQYGVNIALGTIRYDANELRAKMTARKGEKIQKLSKNDFNVGDIVSINHKKINSNLKFKIVKINNKNIKVKAIEGFNSYSVSPSLLVK